MSSDQASSPSPKPEQVDSAKQLADAIAAGERAYESGQYVSHQEAKERLSRWFK